MHPLSYDNLSYQEFIRLFLDKSVNDFLSEDYEFKNPRSGYIDARDAIGVPSITTI